MNNPAVDDVEPPVDADVAPEQIEQWKKLSHGNSIALNLGKPDRIIDALRSASEDKESGPFRETYSYWLGQHLHERDPKTALSRLFSSEWGAACSDARR